MSREILGYVRPNGRIGVRNLVAVLSAMDNANPAANRIGASVAGTVVLSTPFGRTQIGYDAYMTNKTLAGLAGHPNIASVLVLGLSLEIAESFADEIQATGKWIKTLGQSLGRHLGVIANLCSAERGRENNGARR